jgi:hypothetical protein
MDTIYKDDLGNLESFVAVEITKKMGGIPRYWVAKSNSRECQEDVNNTLQNMPYIGESDVERIIEIMTKLGFERCLRTDDMGGNDPGRDLALTETIGFLHIATDSVKTNKKEKKHE